MSWILTNSARQFELMTPKSANITTTDLAHALAHICRFNGHCKHHYSVAQHSLLVASIVPEEHQLAALLHDAPEAYIGDMVRPLKQLKSMSSFRVAEHVIWQAICARFDLDPKLPQCIKDADMIALATERRELMPDHPGKWDCLEGVEPLPQHLPRWTPEEARQNFHDKLLELLGTTHRRRHTA